MPTEPRFVSDVQGGRRKPQRPSDNERKACDAVVRALEALAGCRRTGAHSPEDLGAEAQVEYMFDLACVRHAVEHTIVEAFAGQIRTNVDFQAFVAPIIAALDHNMPPPGRFNLVFDIDPSKGLKLRHIQEAQRAISRGSRRRPPNFTPKARSSPHEITSLSE